MIHNVILALCIAAALAVLSALLWTMIGNKVDPHGGVFPGHIFLHTFDRYLGRKRHSAGIVVGTPSERSLPGGWSLIQRSMRASRATRLAAR
jgi:hypothetical protein